jgi:hypothetical protein
MNNTLWYLFFKSCAELLGPGCHEPDLSESWCSWTTFDRLEDDAGYWTCAMPKESELNETYIADGGTWGQPFRYCEIAHVIVPAHFRWERVINQELTFGVKNQRIADLSRLLESREVPHRTTERVLEIKLY